MATLFAPEMPDRLRRLGRGYDLSGLPLYELARRIAEFRLGDELRRLTTPVLVCASGSDSLWAVQADEFCARLPGSEVARTAPGEDGVSDWIDRFV